jgi:hypothetical protein
MKRIWCTLRASSAGPVNVNPIVFDLPSREAFVAFNRNRIWLGGLAGGVVWNAWSFFVYHFITGWRYMWAQDKGLFLKAPRYPYFQVLWVALLFILAIAVSHLYAWARHSLGPGPGAALKLGFLAGFFAGFPYNFAQAEWFPGPRGIAFGQMVEMWLGAILAALVAGYLYKETTPSKV